MTDSMQNVEGKMIRGSFSPILDFLRENPKEIKKIVSIFKQKCKGGIFIQIFMTKYKRWLKNKVGVSIPLFEDVSLLHVMKSPNNFSTNDGGKSFSVFLDKQQKATVKRIHPLKIACDIFSRIDFKNGTVVEKARPKTFLVVILHGKILEKYIGERLKGVIDPSKTYHITVDFNDYSSKAAVCTVIISCKITTLTTDDGVFKWLDCTIDGKPGYHITLSAPSGKAGIIHDFVQPKIDSDHQTEPITALMVPVCRKKMDKGITSTDHIKIGYDLDDTLYRLNGEAVKNYMKMNPTNKYGFLHDPGFTVKHGEPLPLFYAAVHSAVEGIVHVYTSRRDLERTLKAGLEKFFTGEAEKIVPGIQVVISFQDEKITSDHDKGVCKGRRISNTGCENCVFFDNDKEHAQGASRSTTSFLVEYIGVDLKCTMTHIVPGATSVAPRICLCGPIGGGKSTILRFLKNLIEKRTGLTVKILSTDAPPCDAPKEENLYNFFERVMSEDPDTVYIVDTGATSGKPPGLTDFFRLDHGGAECSALVASLLGVFARSVALEGDERKNVFTLEMDGISEGFRNLLLEYAKESRAEAALEETVEATAEATVEATAEATVEATVEAAEATAKTPSVKELINKRIADLTDMSLLNIVKCFKVSIEGIKNMRQYFKKNKQTLVYEEAKNAEGIVIGYYIKVHYMHDNAKTFDSTAGSEIRGSVFWGEIGGDWEVDSIGMSVGPEVVLFDKNMKTEDSGARFTNNKDFGEVVKCISAGKKIMYFLTKKIDGQNIRLVLRYGYRPGYTKVEYNGIEIWWKAITNNSLFMSDRIMGNVAQAVRAELSRSNKVVIGDVEPEKAAEAFLRYFTLYLKEMILPDFWRITEGKGPGENGSTLTFECVTQNRVNRFKGPNGEEYITPQEGLAVNYGHDMFVFTGWNDHNPEKGYSGQFRSSCMYANEELKLLPFPDHILTEDPKSVSNEFNRILKGKAPSEKNLVKKLEDFGTKHQMVSCGAHNSIRGLDRWHPEGFSVFVQYNGRWYYLKAKTEYYYLCHKPLIRMNKTDFDEALKISKFLWKYFPVLKDCEKLKMLDLCGFIETVKDLYERCISEMTRLSESKKYTGPIPKALLTNIVDKVKAVLNFKGAVSVPKGNKKDSSSASNTEPYWLIRLLFKLSDSDNSTGGYIEKLKESFVAAEAAEVAARKQAEAARKQAEAAAKAKESVGNLVFFALTFRPQENKVYSIMLSEIQEIVTAYSEEERDNIIKGCRYGNLEFSVVEIIDINAVRKFMKGNVERRISSIDTDIISVLL